METPNIQIDNTPTPDQQDSVMQSLPAPQVPQAPAMAQQPDAATQVPAQPRPMGNVLHSILGALGGTSQTSYQVDPNSGAITQTKAPSKPGDQWRTILAGALTGLAAGAGTHGPNGVGEAVSRGFAGGIQAVQNSDQQKRQQAEQQSKDIQQAKLNQASMVLMQQKTAAAALDLADKHVDLNSKVAGTYNAFQQLVANTPNAHLIGTFKTEQEAMQAAAANNGAGFKGHTANTISLLPKFERDKDGNLVGAGFEAWQMPAEWGKQKVETDQEHWMPTPDGKGGVKYQKYTVPAGSMTNEQNQQLYQKELIGAATPAELQKPMQPKSNHMVQLEVGGQPHTVMVDEQGNTVKDLGPTGIKPPAVHVSVGGPGGADDMNPKLYTPINKAAGTYEKNATDAENLVGSVHDAISLVNQGAYGQMLGVIDTIKNLAGGKGSGVRITKAEIEGILKPVGLGDSLEAIGNRLAGGSQLTAKQKAQLTAALNRVGEEATDKASFNRDMVGRIRGSKSLNELNNNQGITMEQWRKNKQPGSGNQQAEASNMIQVSVNGHVGAIPASQRDAFLKKYPDAVIH